MDDTTLYIIIGAAALVLINLIVILIIAKRNKKARKLAMQQGNQGNTPSPYQQEEEAKTEVLGNSYGAPRNASVDNSDKTAVLAPITNLSADEKREIKQQSLRGADQTQLLTSSFESNPNVTGNLEQEQAPIATIEYQEAGSAKQFDLTKEFISIGRDPQSSDILLTADNYIGRQHALIYKNHMNKKFYLVDLDSKNGTFINDQKVTGQQEITEETLFRVGKTKMTLTINGG